MLNRRVAKLVPPWDRLNRRIEHLEIAVRELQAATRDLVGYIQTELNDGLAAADALNSAALRTVADDSHAHAEVVLVAAREHAEAAARNAELAARAGAREHTEAALDAQAAELSAAAHQSAVAAAGAALADAMSHSEQLHHQTLDHVGTELAKVRRELQVVSRLGSASREPAPTGEPVMVQDTVDAALYVALEDRFRGSPELIRRRQEVYLPLLADLIDDEHPVVDLGCGRGEWLRLLHDHGIAARGVDSNPAFAAEVAELGIDIELGDLVHYLRSVEEASVGAITMFHVVEHLPFAVLVEVLGHCARVIRPGGLLIAETPNATNVRVAATTFWLDPTHQRPLHPDLLRFLANYVGFAKTDGWFLNPLRDDFSAAGDPADLAVLFDGPGDFALLAWTS